jgi:transcriptional regulator with XRE-family HTH domain
VARSKRFAERFPARDSLMVRRLAANVRQLRRAKGWSQEALAAEADIEQTAVSLIENSRANPTVLAVGAIAKALGVGFPDLFKPLVRSRSSNT